MVSYISYVHGLPAFLDINFSVRDDWI